MKTLLQNTGTHSTILMNVSQKNIVNTGILSSDRNMQMRVAGKKNIVNLNDILYLKSAKNYTVFRMINGNELISSKTLRIFEEELEDVVNFVRPHRSFMVNFDHIEDLKLNCRGGEILLNDEIIEISRRKAAGVRRKYRRFLAANAENNSFTMRLKTKLK